MAWTRYQFHTVRDGRLIEFLARRNVIPKYGFRVDVVELDLSRSGDQAADGIELDRDLRRLGRLDDHVGLARGSCEAILGRRLVHLQLWIGAAPARSGCRVPNAQNECIAPTWVSG